MNRKTKKIKTLTTQKLIIYKYICLYFKFYFYLFIFIKGANKFKPTFLSASDSNLGGGLIGANNNNNKQANATSSSNDIGSQLKSQQSTIASSTQQQNLATAALKDNKSTTPTATTKLQGQQQHAQTAGGRHHQLHHHPHHQAINVPQFYFPHGRHDDRQFRSIDDVECMKQLSVEFKAKKDGKMFKEDFVEVTKLLGLPCYWKILLFRACTAANKLTYVTYSVFEQVWSKYEPTFSNSFCNLFIYIYFLFLLFFKTYLKLLRTSCSLHEAHIGRKSDCLRRLGTTFTSKFKKLKIKWIKILIWIWIE